MSVVNKKGKDFFGPVLWQTIHILAATYTPTKENYIAFKNFTVSLMYLIPCDLCKNHFKEFLKAHPIEKYMENNNSLFFWSYLCHDNVNRLQNKKSPEYAYVRAFYFNSLKDDCKHCGI